MVLNAGGFQVRPTPMCLSQVSPTMSLYLPGPSSKAGLQQHEESMPTAAQQHEVFDGRRTQASPWTCRKLAGCTRTIQTLQHNNLALRAKCSACAVGACIAVQ